jgi:hypothetical protein
VTDPGPLGYADWRSQRAGVGPKKYKNARKKQRTKLKNRYGAYQDNYTPVEQPFVNPAVGANAPAAQALWRQMWQSASPLERGYDSTRWRAPKRTIEFALLLASLGVIVGAVIEALA